MLKLLPEWLKIGGSAVLGGLVTFSVYATINALVLIPAAEQRGRDSEAAELTAATNIAIGELSNAADQARVRRRLCVERHGVYDFAKGECIEAKPDVHD